VTSGGERTLVIVFLRGGADGLSLVPPLGDDGYYRARPSLAVSRGDAVHLDGFFGLHPGLRDLEPFYRDGRLAIVHGVGSEDDTRSHFEAQALMERGGLAAAGGWFGRWLRQNRPRGGAAGLDSNALRAVAFGAVLPESLGGAPGATALRSLGDLSLGEGDRLRGPLSMLYAHDEMLGTPARHALEALDQIEGLRRSASATEGAHYGTDTFSEGLELVARLIKARVGLEAACVDLPGWDSHFFQSGVVDPLARRLGTGLCAFAKDLGSHLSSTSIVVMSEFGRRVHENSSMGTDHGRGGVMFVLGGGTAGGVHGPWPGLKEEDLEGPGDLPVVHNFRDVLLPILARHGTLDTESVFPGHSPRPLPL